MAKTPSRRCSDPDAYGVIPVRTGILILDIAAIAIYAVSISTYNNRVFGPHVPSGKYYPLVVNAVSLVPSCISALWSIIHLSLLGRGICCLRRQRGPADSGNGAQNSRRAAVNPAWVLVVDIGCFIFFLVVTVLTSIRASNWKSGKVPYEVQGTGVITQVDLNSCPSIDEPSGTLAYWCEPAWNKVVDLTSAGTAILGTLTYVPFTWPLTRPFSHFSRTSSSQVIPSTSTS